MTIKELEILLRKLKDSGADENSLIKSFRGDSNRLADFDTLAVNAYIDSKDKWSVNEAATPCVIFLGIKM